MCRESCYRMDMRHMTPKRGDALESLLIGLLALLTVGQVVAAAAMAALSFG